MCSSDLTLGLPSDVRSPVHAEVMAICSALDAAIPPGGSWAIALKPVEVAIAKNARVATRPGLSFQAKLIAKNSFCWIVLFSPSTAITCEFRPPRSLCQSTGSGFINGACQTPIYDRDFVKRGRCRFCVAGFPHIPFAFGFGRSCPSQTCPRTSWSCSP